jgi:hypothetical protein
VIFATSDPSSGRSRSRFRRAFKWLIMSMALIVAGGAVFQPAMTQWESYRYPPRGKLVDIGGLRLHINCTGAGSPTVIMEAAQTPELIAACRWDERTSLLS